MNKERKGIPAYLIFIFYTIIFFSCNQINAQAVIDSSCITSIEKKQVRGTSLTGLTNDGSSVILAYGFYNCNAILLNDIVAYKYGGSKIPLIKIVKALPGNTFHIIQKDDFYYIEVNKQAVTYSTGLVFKLPQQEYAMLKMYEEAYHGVIPPDSYLILGNRSGTTDSGKFGLVSKADILGKVIKVITAK